jgi:hypothetical protein
MGPRAFLALSLVLTGLASQAARADLVANGNFASGDLTSWAATDASIVIDSLYTPPYNADAYDAAFSGSGTLSQDIPTIAGQEYTLSFSLLDEAGFFLDTFNVNFGGFSTTITGDTASTYQTEVFDVPASDITGTDTTLSFQGLSAVDANWNLDDVSVVPVVTAVPEPTATAILAGAVVMVVSLRRHQRMVRNLPIYDA